MRDFFKANQKNSPKNSAWREFFFVLVILGLAVWCAHLWKFQEYGLYEDDYHFAYDGWYHFSEELVVDTLTNWAEGRPLGWLLLISLHKLGSFFGKLPASYLIAYPILLTDAILFYYLLKRIAPSMLFALSGALGLTLFPGHTTQFFLTHAYLEAIAILCLILSFHWILSGKKILAYFFAALILFIYETPYPVFFAAPLLLKDITLKKWGKHLLISVLIIAGYFVTRSLMMQDHRVESLFSQPSQHLITLLRSLLIGPKYTLTSFFWSTRYTLTHWQTNLYFVSLISGVLFFLVYLFMIKNTLRTDKEQQTVHFHSRNIRLRGIIKWSPRVTHQMKIILVALLMLVLSYSLSLTRLPNIRAGKTTSSHIGATLPFGMLFGSGLFLIGYFFNVKRLPAVSAAIVALVFSSLFSFRWLIMEDFVKSWTYQRWYFTQVASLCPDLSEDKVLIVQPVNQYEETFINTYNLVSSVVLAKMHDSPINIRYLFFLDNPDVFSIARIENDVYYIAGERQVLIPHESHDLIILSFKDGMMIREAGPVELAGETFQALPFPDDPVTEFTLSDFGRILFEPDMVGQPLPDTLMEE
jgi:hypothetical protein